MRDGFSEASRQIGHVDADECLAQRGRRTVQLQALPVEKSAASQRGIPEAVERRRVGDADDSFSLVHQGDRDRIPGEPGHKIGRAIDGIGDPEGSLGIASIAPEGGLCFDRALLAEQGRRVNAGQCVRQCILNGGIGVTEQAAIGFRVYTQRVPAWQDITSRDALHKLGDGMSTARPECRVGDQRFCHALYNTSMVIPRFYIPQPLTVGDCVTLPEAVANHAVRVLRLQAGDSLVLFNGEGGAYEGVLLAQTATEQAPAQGKAKREGKQSRASKQREVQVLLKGFQPDDRASPLRIRLWQGVSAAERMDYTWQKAVELGVHQCVPVEMRRCVMRLEGERAEKRHAHWQGVIVAAAEQCGLNRLPALAPVRPLAEVLRDTPTTVRVMLDPDATESYPDWLARQADLTDLTILIGPEGGFAPEEIEAAKAAGFLCFRLGPRVFRTETAGPVALAVTQAIAGDLR